MSVIAANTIQSLNPGVDPIDIQASAVTINGSPIAGGGSEHSAIFDPDAVPSGNVYDDLGLALTALAAVELPRELIVRKTGIPLTLIPIPAASYDFSGVDVYTDNTNTYYPILSFDTGSTITTWPTYSRGVSFRGNNTTTPLSSVSSFMGLVLESATILNYGTFPVMDLLAGSQVLLRIIGENSSGLFNGNSEPIKLTSGSSLTIITDGDTNFRNNSNLFIGDGTGGGITLRMLDLHVGGYSATHANLNGATFTLTSTAEDRVTELLAGDSISRVSVFHFDPNNAPTGNRYNNFTALMVSVNAAVAGGNFVDIYFTTTADVVVPAATYDFTNCRLLHENMYTNQWGIEFADGTLIPRFFYETDVSLRFVNTTNSVTYFGAGDLDRIKFTGGAQITNNGAFAVFETNHTTAYPQFTLKDDVVFLTGGTAPIIKVTLGAVLINVNDRADVVQNATSPFFLDVAAGKSASIFNSTLLPYGVGKASDYGAGVATIVNYGGSSGSGTFASGDLTWDGTSPSGFISGTWSFVRIGKIICLTFHADYGTPGTGNTTAVLDISGFDINLPTPAITGGLPGSLSVTGAARLANLFYQSVSSSVEAKFESTNANRFTAQITYEAAS